MLALLAETLGSEEICGVIHISLSPVCSDGTIIISALAQPCRQPAPERRARRWQSSIDGWIKSRYGLQPARQEAQLMCAV